MCVCVQKELIPVVLFRVFQHVVFFVGRMIDWAVPDVPETLRIKIKRENYLAKQALTDNIVLDITV